jgi:alpha-beta hydrolase superfamily lysophospholipase
MARPLPLVPVLIWLLWAVSAQAQSLQKHVLPPAFPRSGKATTRLFYQLDPLTPTARGLLVLLPGLGEPARDVLRATHLAQEAAKRGFVVLLLGLNDHLSLDSASTRFLDDAIAAVVRQRPAVARQLVLGGFSAGGQLAFAYAEGLVRDSAQRPWRVRAVLGVDPPLDLTTHWQRAQLHVDRRDCAPFRVYDQRSLSYLTHELGGSPAQFPARYRAASAFTRSDPAGGNAQWLRGVSVRLYSEPDLAFWQATCPAYQPEDLNADGAAALVACLQRLGNQRASFLPTTDKGFVGKHRMPHSWSIVDAVECAQWLQHCLE